MWKKELESKHLQSFDLLALVIIALLLVGFIMQNNVTIIAAGLLTVHLIMLKIFENKITENLSMKDSRKTIRLFPGESIPWKLEMENASKFPLINGKLRLNLGFHVQVTNINKKHYWQGIEIPISLPPRNKVIKQISVTALKRGTARVSQLRYEFPHLFSFQEMTMQYNRKYQTEFIVYPELKEVAGLEAIFHLYPGETGMQYSPYEDIQSPVGTRDYQAGDSFQRINWKASVRSGELQTNVFEKVADRSFVFLVNLMQEQKSGEGERMENLLSYTAYLSKYATEQGVPYELRLNVVQPGRRQFLIQQEASGAPHLAKSLELLARIPRQPIVNPFELLLFDTSNKLKQRKTIVLIGKITENEREQIVHLERKGHTIFQLTETDGAAFILPLQKERIA